MGKLGKTAASQNSQIDVMQLVTQSHSERGSLIKCNCKCNSGAHNTTKKMLHRQAAEFNEIKIILIREASRGTIGKLIEKRRNLTFNNIAGFLLQLATRVPESIGSLGEAHENVPFQRGA